MFRKLTGAFKFKKMEKIQKDIELSGYETEDGGWINERVEELHKRVEEYMQNYGIPQIGIKFYDGNMGVLLTNILYANDENGPVFYFSFHAD